MRTHVKVSLRRAARWGFTAGLLLAISWAGPDCRAGEILARPGEDPALVGARVYAATFLRNATFGPTMEQIDALAARMLQIGHREAAEEWIDNQFALPVTSAYDFAKTWFENNEAVIRGEFPNNGLVIIEREVFNTIPIVAPDQLRQRLTFALSQILVVNKDGSGTLLSLDSNNQTYSALGLAGYWDLLAQGIDGTYRDLLQAVAIHPVMGQFLTHAHNSKADPATGQFPDENFAREIMQLFTIGLWKLNQDGSYQLAGNELIPTYGPLEIENMARVFTGLTWNNGLPDSHFGQGVPNYHDSLRMVEGRHDTNPKTIFNGIVLPGGQDGMTEIRAAVDLLEAHANTAPFIARRLIQRFTASNPTKEYIRRVADVYDDNGQGVRGDLKAITKAILLDPDATDDHIFVSPTGVVVGGIPSNTAVRTQDPFIQYTTLFRAFHANCNEPGGLVTVRTRMDDLPQIIMASPTVFNFFQPDHVVRGPLSDTPAPESVPNGYYSSPELTLYDSYYANHIANSIAMTIDAGYVNRGIGKTMLPQAWQTTLDFSAEMALAGDMNALLERLDLLLCSGSMKQSVRDAVVAAIVSQTNSDIERVEAAITTVMLSPDFVTSEVLPLRRQNQTAPPPPSGGMPVAGVPIATQPVLIEHGLDPPPPVVSIGPNPLSTPPPTNETATDPAATNQFPPLVQVPTTEPVGRPATRVEPRPRFVQPTLLTSQPASLPTPERGSRPPRRRDLSELWRRSTVPQATPLSASQNASPTTGKTLGMVASPSGSQSPASGTSAAVSTIASDVKTAVDSQSSAPAQPAVRRPAYRPSRPPRGIITSARELEVGSGPAPSAASELEYHATTSDGTSRSSDSPTASPTASSGDSSGDTSADTTDQ
jgi:uncharacterized protein (DUF1800 family)